MSNQDDSWALQNEQVMLENRNDWTYCTGKYREDEETWNFANPYSWKGKAYSQIHLLDEQQEVARETNRSPIYGIKQRCLHRLLYEMGFGGREISPVQNAKLLIMIVGVLRYGLMSAAGENREDLRSDGFIRLRTLCNSKHLIYKWENS